MEPGRPKDVFVNLRVLWCKLLISLDPKSIAYEGMKPSMCCSDPNTSIAYEGSTTNNELPPVYYYYATYRMLPPISIKWAIRYLGLWRVFPRWMHANIELRVVYLQTALKQILENFNSSTSMQQQRLQEAGHKEWGERTCVIVLGGGYDPRGTELLLSSRNNVQRVYELDLPQVVDSKRKLLRRAGYGVKNNNDDDDHEMDVMPNALKGVQLEGVDLNDEDGVDRVLDKIRNELTTTSETNRRPTKWKVLLVSEALLLYLDPGKAEHILRGVSERFRFSNANDCPFQGASFVFADRLMRHTDTTPAAASKQSRRSMALPTSREEMEHETALVRSWLSETGWELNELLFKPGATRHLGIATTTRTATTTV